MTEQHDNDAAREGHCAFMIAREMDGGQVAWEGMPDNVRAAWRAAARAALTVYEYPTGDGSPGRVMFEVWVDEMGAPQNKWRHLDGAHVRAWDLAASAAHDEYRRHR